METLQFLQRRKGYILELENYIELLLICSTFTFVIESQFQGCFCIKGYAWQFGALSVFLAWIDLILHLKKLPLTAIPINMLQSIVVTFLKLMYLPLALLIAFSIPFYMLFSRVSTLLTTCTKCNHAYKYFLFSRIFRLLLTHRHFHF